MMLNIMLISYTTLVFSTYDIRPLFQLEKRCSHGVFLANNTIVIVFPTTTTEQNNSSNFEKEFSNPDVYVLVFFSVLNNSRVVVVHFGSQYSQLAKHLQGLLMGRTYLLEA